MSIIIYFEEAALAGIGPEATRRRKLP